MIDIIRYFTIYDKTTSAIQGLVKGCDLLVLKEREQA